MAELEVVLRAPREDDVPALVEGCRDPLTKRFTARVPDPYGPEEARAFVALCASTREAGEEWHVAIADARTDELLGMTGVHHIDREAGDGYAGYWVGPRHRGRGVATAALRLVVAAARDELGLRRLQLQADVDNPASHRVAEAAGFVRVGFGDECVGATCKRPVVEYALDLR